MAQRRAPSPAPTLEAVEIGASGDVAAVADPAELVAAIRKVAEGEDPSRLAAATTGEA